MYQRGLQTFVWRAEDANDDELRYEMFYRREGETAWKSLKGELPEAIFVWDTTSVPNGTYVVKVVASDQPSNTPGGALEGELESSAFDIDNAPPVVIVSTSRAANGRTHHRVRSPRRVVVDFQGGVLARRAALAGRLSS